MLVKDCDMEAGEKEPEVGADEGLCMGQDGLGSPFHSSGSSPSSLLPPYLEGRAPAAPSLPPPQPSSGPAEGDPPPHLAAPPQPQLSPGAFRPLNPHAAGSPSGFVVHQHPLFPPPTAGEDSDRMTPGSDGSSSSLDRLTPDEVSQRTLRKRRVGGGLAAIGSISGQCTCPVCGVTVRPHELLAHFQQEAKLLCKIPKLVGRHAKDSVPSTSQLRRSSSPISSSGPSSSTGRRDSCDSKVTCTSRLEIFERIRANRNGRLSARAGRTVIPGANGEEYQEAQCPVCQRRLHGNATQLNRHVESCLRKRDSGGSLSSEDEDVDVEGESSAAAGQENGEVDQEEDEYRWAGQTRLRVTSMLRGHFQAVGFTTVRPSAEDDEDLNVDGDDTATYGQPQYSESDVIPCGTESVSKEDRALRRALSTRNEEGVTQASTSALPTENAREQISQDNTDSPEEHLPNGPVKIEPQDPDDQKSEGPSSTLAQSSPQETLNNRPSAQRHLIAALYQQIAELRGHQPGQGPLKCLVCMDPYNKPVVSVGCWHVYCEECWLKTLGAKKLCPQCNTITSASDLRKIYM